LIHTYEWRFGHRQKFTDTRYQWDVSYAYPCHTTACHPGFVRFATSRMKGLSACISVF